MQIANVKQRQILPRVGKIWASTPQIAEEGEDAERREEGGQPQGLPLQHFFNIFLRITLPKYLFKLHSAGQDTNGIGRIAHIMHKLESLCYKVATWVVIIFLSASSAWQ